MKRCLRPLAFVILLALAPCYAAAQGPKLSEIFYLQGIESDVRCVAFSSDGCSLAAGGRDKRVVLWDLNTKRKLAILECGDMISSVSFSPDGKLIAARLCNRELVFWDVVAFGKQKIFDSLNDVTSFAFSPDGKTMVTTDSDDGIHFWDSKTGKQMAEIKGNDRKPRIGIGQLAFSQDGLRLATTGFDGNIAIWDTKSLKRITTLKNGEPVGSMCFGKDGKSLASADSIWSNRNFLAPMPVPASANNIKIWDISNGKVARELAGHADNIAQVQLVEDGNYLASASYDGTVRIWNLANGRETEKLDRAENGGIFTIHISKDGNRAAYGGADSIVHVLKILR